MTGFRRLVLELGHGAADLTTMRQAAAFARLLDAELHALFVEDETLLHASALPFAREINPLSFQWRKLDPNRLTTDLHAAADHARRRLMEITNAIGVRREFEVRRGDLAMNVTEICVASDILVLALPRLEASDGSRRLREMADRSAASVLYLPPNASRRRGPVAVVLTGADDPALAVAQSIAAQYHARLQVLRVEETIVSAPGDMRERLIVMTRGAADGAALAIARGVAVLVVEPARSVADPV